MGRIARVEDFNDLIVGTLGRASDHAARHRDGGERLRGAALLREPRRPPRGDARGPQAERHQQPCAVVERVKKRLAELAQVIPPDIHYQVIKDQCRFINNSINEAKFHLMLGAILVALSTLLFMGDLRSTLIAAVAIPTSIIVDLHRALGARLHDQQPDDARR